LAAAPLVLDSLKAHGTLEGKQLTLPAIEGRLYGGHLKGSARAGWAQGLQVAGKAAAPGGGLAPGPQALGKTAKLTGKLNTTLSFSAAARLPEQLAAALSVDGPFAVAGGAYQGVDLSKVGELTGGGGSGGTTRFDQLRGVLQLRGKQIRVNELCA